MRRGVPGLDVAGGSSEGVLEFPFGLDRSARTFFLGYGKWGNKEFKD